MVEDADALDVRCRFCSWAGVVKAGWRYNRRTRKQCESVSSSARMNGWAERARLHFGLPWEETFRCLIGQGAE